jgi:anti-sigma B factor antagonist
MQITERTAGDVTILDISGRLTWMEGDETFKTKIADLVERGKLKILLNLANVTYIDSAGVGALVGRYVSLARQGGALKLLNLTSRSHKVMVITRLNKVFESFDDEATALSSFAKNA